MCFFIANLDKLRYDANESAKNFLVRSHKEQSVGMRKSNQLK